MKTNDFVCFEGHTKKVIYGTLEKIFEKSNKWFCIIKDMNGLTHIQRLYNVKEVA